MTDTLHALPRALAPRRLEQVETLQSLNHWRTVIKNYFRRCQYYGYFLTPGLKWDNTANRGFIAEEPTDLKELPKLWHQTLKAFSLL